jgi:hypothetical protein
MRPSVLLFVLSILISFFFVLHLLISFILDQPTLLLDGIGQRRNGSFICEYGGCIYLQTTDHSFTIFLFLCYMLFVVV